MAMPKASPDQPTVLICLGAAKAGTSWLYDYLASHPDCHLRKIKEVNYFNKLKGRAWQYMSKTRREQRQVAERQLGQSMWFQRTKRAALKQRVKDIDAWLDIDPAAPGHEAYVRYLCDGRKSQKLVGDFTPEYIALSPDILREIVSSITDVRFVLLLRDPVDRVWSHIRMNAERSSQKDRQFEVHISRQTEKFVSGNHIGMAERSDYATCLRNLSETVDPSRLHVVFFEHLFAPETGPATLRALTDFLGIAPKPARFDVVSNQSPEIALDVENRDRIRTQLQPQYEYCARRFGNELPQRWKQQMAEAA